MDATDAVNDYTTNDCCEAGASALSKNAVYASSLTGVDIDRFGVGSRIAGSILVGSVWVLSLS